MAQTKTRPADARPSVAQQRSSPAHTSNARRSNGSGPARASSPARSSSARKSSARSAPTRIARSSSGAEALGEHEARCRNEAVKPEQVTRCEVRFVHLAAVDRWRNRNPDGCRRLDRSAVGKAGDSVGAVAQKAKTPAMVGTTAAAGLAEASRLVRELSRPKGPVPPAGRRR